MFADESFNDVMRRVRAGDDTAETMVFRRFVRRLIVLAAKQFDSRMRDRADVENVVLSAFESFFIRNERGDFLLADWGELWSILAMITLRKCGKRLRYLKAARRDASSEVTLRESGIRESSDFRTGLPHRSRPPSSPRPSSACFNLWNPKTGRSSNTSSWATRPRKSPSNWIARSAPCAASVSTPRIDSSN